MLAAIGEYDPVNLLLSFACSRPGGNTTQNGICGPSGVISGHRSCFSVIKAHRPGLPRERKVHRRFTEHLFPDGPDVTHSFALYGGAPRFKEDEAYTATVTNLKYNLALWEQLVRHGYVVNT